jgi:hypothetical protein
MVPDALRAKTGCQFGMVSGFLWARGAMDGGKLLANLCVRERG